MTDPSASTTGAPPDIPALIEEGKALATQYDMAYVCLLAARHGADRSRQLLSPKCATRWRVFPHTYDEASRELAVAVSAREQIPALEKIHRFFLQSHTLSFTIASEAEIETALIRHAGAKRNAAGDLIARPSALSITSLGKSRTIKARTTALAGDGAPAELDDEVDALSQALITLASILVCRDLGETEIQAARDCARYSEMLASRLPLRPQQVREVVLAAWFWNLSQRTEILGQLRLPIGQIIREAESTPGGALPEAKVLSLVHLCLTLRADNRDVQALRSRLERDWPYLPADTAMVEAMLQILLDEDYLQQLEKKTGRILLVDPAEVAQGKLAPTLSGQGYDVNAVASADDAVQAIATSPPHLVIIEMNLPGEDGLTLCRRVKQSNPDLPVAIVTAPRADNIAAHCLKAGADDVLLKPIDLELLILKVRNLAGRTAAGGIGDVADGVSGSLADMSFTDMVQILCAGGKSVEIVLSNNDGDESHVFIEDGNITQADSDGLEGEQAFYALMRWNEGTFTTRLCDSFPERAIQASPMGLLMEGARLIDEGGPEASPEVNP
tara:strand:- start:513 stop:2186 length:1674 start_codon:yes stop_codon:yes gene_type:complete